MKKLLIAFALLIAAFGVLGGTFIGYKYLTLPEVIGDEASWSPDGRYLTVASVQNNVRQLHRLSLTTGLLTPVLAAGENVHYGNWSPDGGTLAYSARRDGSWFLCFLQVGQLREFCPFNTATFNPMRPQWGNDNRGVYISALRDGDMDIHFVSLVGDANRVASLPQDQSFISFDANNDRLVVSQNTNDGRALFAVNLSDGSTFRLTEIGVNASQPSVNPATGEIAFVVRTEGGPQIVVLSASGDFTQLTNTGSNFGPAWSADGDQLAFTSDRDGDLAIYIYESGDARIYRVPSRLREPLGEERQ
jgi:Tol biopolymer transport system component